ncbi:MAG: guanyl-specific ribonuclease Sa [Rhodocyclales bacterium]|nr:guanyl-specific ribonuclease Sa [Rhodocyclales bacterium]
MKSRLFRCLLLCLVTLGMASISPSLTARTATALATINVSELPGEVLATLRLVRHGGPFPYRRDGIEFQNRESRLPRRQPGYYHEYTVPTPGANDRGARRIIVGESEEFYFTADHYRSFKRVVP